MIKEDYQAKLWAYLAGRFKELGCHPIKVGGVSDHMHALVELGRTMTICNLIGNVKSESSKWMKREQQVTDFAWQNGYGAFSVSASQCDEVVHYIENQQVHHRKQFNPTRVPLRYTLG